jgi:small-conductance mechanosensitive channel
VQRLGDRLKTRVPACDSIGPVTRVFYGNTTGEYLTAGAIALGFLVLAAAIRGLLRRRFAHAHETANEWDDLGLDLALRTRLSLLLLPAIYLGARALEVAPVQWRFIRHAATISIIAQGALWASAVVDFWLKRYQRNRVAVEPEAVTTINAFRVAIIAGIWVVAVLSAIANLGFDITALITGLGIGGVAIALATQNILGDIFASLSIVIDKPFVVGDFIVVDTASGTVENIGLKTTRIRSISGEQLIIGNGDLLKSRIRNFKRMWERRVVFRLGVVYQTPAAVLEQLPGIIRSVIEAQPKTRVDRVHFVNLGESALEFEAVYFMTVSDYLAYADTQQAINLGIIRAFQTSEVEFAYPTRTLFVG